MLYTLSTTKKNCPLLLPFKEIYTKIKALFCSPVPYWNAIPFLMKFVTWLLISFFLFTVLVVAFSLNVASVVSLHLKCKMCSIWINLLTMTRCMQPTYLHVNNKAIISYAMLQVKWNISFTKTIKLV